MNDWKLKKSAFYNSTKNITYLDINLRYVDKYKTLIKEIKENLYKW